MDMTNQEYCAYVDRMAKPSPMAKDLAWAFCVGGLICTAGQWLLGFYRRAGLCAPEDGAAEEAFPGQVREMKLARRALTDRGTLAAVAKGFRVHAACLAEGLDRLRSTFGDAPFTLAQARDALGVSRKYALLVLEHWDRAGVTEKNGEARVLR